MIFRHINKNKLSILCLFTLLVNFGCSKEPTDVQVQQQRNIDHKLGTKFTDIEESNFRVPNISNLTLPPEKNGAVSWGATGRDDNGNIYFGVSTYTSYDNTAFLYQLNSQTNEIEYLSDVITELKHSGFYKEGDSQNKLHSKFYQADDGYVYFTSFDETGESESKQQLPTFGGHIWRIKPGERRWEHMLSTKEALIALNTDGRYVYALGYWNHVLYQYDTLSRRFNRLTVGSADGHVSRNILTSKNRVFVPKVEKSKEGNTLVHLIEYDTELNMLDAHPLEHYMNENIYGSHGIVSYSTLKNGDIYFITGKGALYKIAITNNDKRNVEFISFISDSNSPGGYFPSLFTLDGQDFLVGMGVIKGTKQYSWFIHELSTNTTVTYDLPDFNNQFLLYGSVTRNEDGDMFIVGVDRNNRSKNIVQILKAHYPK